MADSNDKLYFVDVNRNKNLLLCLNVHLSEEEGETIVHFFDTNRDRIFIGKMISMDNNGFVFQTKNGDMMTFRVATLNEYNSHWRGSIEGHVPQFSSDKELSQWYYHQFI